MAGKLKGTSIRAGTISTTQLNSSLTQSISSGGGPKLKTIIYPEDDTAANTDGGQTIYLNGSGFNSDFSLYINGNAVATKSFISSSNVSFTTPALSSATYPVYLVNNTDGAMAILVPGIQYSNVPVWTTSSSLSADDTIPWNLSLSATSDSNITYSLAAGSSLPGGISLASNGALTGTLSSPPASDTTYNFTVVATDVENQNESRAFGVTVSVGDPQFYLTTLLVQADGTNNGNNHTFVTGGNTAYTLLRSGNATQGSFSPYSQTGWSNYFDGSGDYLSIANSTALDLPGDFTIELWWHPMSLTGTQSLAGKWGAAQYAWLVQATSSNIILVTGSGGGAVTTISNAWTPAIGNWYHIAFTRSGTNVKAYINGTQVGTTQTSDKTCTSTATTGIGANPDGPQEYSTGFISNLRVVKGSVVYSANFTPSTTALTAIANTSLLTCQSNRFRDASTNNFTITVNGDPRVTAFTPFKPTTTYAPATQGGSVYLDGNDFVYSSLSGTTNLQLGTQDFTIEAWLWLFQNGTTAANETYAPIANLGRLGNTTSSSRNAWHFNWNPQAGNRLAFSTKSGDSFSAPNFYSATSNVLTLPLHSWHHVAVTRESGTLKFWCNGSFINSVDGWGSYALDSYTEGFFLGNSTGGNSGEFAWYFPGYISDFRVVKGNAVYTGNTTYSVPTQALANVANTVMLISGNNAQIYDSTSRSVMETIGDAKVNTSIYKFGAGSMSFDGTGDYLSIQTTPNLNFGTGDFTIECWVRHTTIVADTFYISATGTGGLFFGIGGTNSTTMGYGRVNTAWDYSAAHGMSTATWYHVAITRSGTSIRMFVNGSQIGTTQTSSTSYNLGLSSTTVGSQGANYYFNGFIGELRVTKGYARYTANFTAPTAKFKDK